MIRRIITDISNFIFVSDTPRRVDAIFLPGGSHPEGSVPPSFIIKDMLRCLFLQAESAAA